MYTPLIYPPIYTHVRGPYIGPYPIHMTMPHTLWHGAMIEGEGSVSLRLCAGQVDVCRVIPLSVRHCDEAVTLAVPSHLRVPVAGQGLARTVFVLAGRDSPGPPDHRVGDRVGAGRLGQGSGPRRGGLDRCGLGCGHGRCGGDPRD